MLSAPPPPPIALENVSAFGNFALPLLAWLLALVTAWLAMDRLVLRWLDYLRRIAGALRQRQAHRAAAAREAAGARRDQRAGRHAGGNGRPYPRPHQTGWKTPSQARDAAMKEIHHRVKNNLQIINSLLSLQGRKLKDPAAIAVLDDARARINALSLIHRSLYEHNDIRTVADEVLPHRTRQPSRPGAGRRGPRHQDRQRHRRRYDSTPTVAVPSPCSPPRP